MPQIHWHPPASFLVAEIAALSAGDHLAVDADGTLWDVDIGDELVALTRDQPQAFTKRFDAGRYFADLAADHGLASAYSAWVAGNIRPSLLEQLLAQRLQSRLNPRASLVSALSEAVARGVSVHVVSASPEIALRWPLTHIELQPTSVIAAPAVTAALPAVDTLPVGVGKVASWRNRALPTPALAIGDSRWDLPLLASAEVGVLVRPWSVELPMHAENSGFSRS